MPIIAMGPTGSCSHSPTSSRLGSTSRAAFILIEDTDSNATPNMIDGGLPLQARDPPCYNRKSARLRFPVTVSTDVRGAILQVLKPLEAQRPRRRNDVDLV